MGILQHQTLRSTVVIYLGFAIGAFNTMIIMPRCLNPDEYGLLRMLSDVALTFYTFAVLGTHSVNGKFFPYFNDRLKENENDLSARMLVQATLGIILFVFLIWIFKPQLLSLFKEKAPLFSEYFGALFPLLVFGSYYVIFEAFTTSRLNTILPSFTREVVLRIYTTIIVVLYFLKLLDLSALVALYSLMYVPIAVWLLWYSYKVQGIRYVFKKSIVTRRLRKKMLQYQGFVVAGTSFYIIAQTMDTILIGGILGLAQTSIFTIATFMATILQVPQRAMYQIALPIASQAWKDNNRDKLQEIYQKSSLTLLLVGSLLLLLIWNNIHIIYGVILPPKFGGGEIVFLILGISKVIDLGTGLNNAIILTSNKWRFDFITGIILILLTLTLNLYLIPRYGIIGSAWSNLLSFTVFNLIRFVFLYVQFGLFPFTKSTLILASIIIICFICGSILPKLSVWWLDVAYRSTFLAVLYLGLCIGLKISTDLNYVLHKQLIRFKIIKNEKDTNL